MKLPKPIKSGDAYRIQIQIDGKRISCKRDTIKECEQWAARTILESKIAQNDEEKGVKPKITFRELLDQYYNNVGQFKESRSSRDWMKGQLSKFD